MKWRCTALPISEPLQKQLAAYATQVKDSQMVKGSPEAVLIG